ncbi:glutathione S-transferase theta-1 [Procambarus clarkii]
MTATLTLHVDYISQPARALLLLCRAINAPHQEKYMELLQGDHLKKPFTDLNPFRKVPVVQDGDVLILESCTGLRYIASKYDSSGKWYPKELKARCKVDEYLDWQHLNTRAHGVGYFYNKIIVPILKKSEPDMNVVNEHELKLGQVETQFASYFLGSKPFITGQNITIADLLAACEFEQPSAGGYQLSQPILEYLSRVKEAVGPDYDELHTASRQLAQKRLA